MVKWRDRAGSKNVEDRRAAGAAAAVIPVILRLVFSRYGIGGAVALVAGLFVLKAVGLNPLGLLGGGAGGARDEGAAQFASAVLAETEEIWGELFTEAGRSYEEPTLVLFSGQVGSACGFASAASGPFYCPGDRKVYLDTTFFADLSEQFGAPGDFGGAYVIAHEIGHHIQTLIGVTEKVRAAQAEASEEQANAIQVRMELQADCYAGVWASAAERMNDFLDQGDLEEGLRAASAIGDDTLQRNAGARVTPESFTHGTSEHRARWFRRGFSSADPDWCDTYTAETL
jgi:predicted metalloprotease